MIYITFNGLSLKGSLSAIEEIKAMAVATCLVVQELEYLR
jgi:hypothetical protein